MTQPSICIKTYVVSKQETIDIHLILRFPPEQNNQNGPLLEQTLRVLEHYDVEETAAIHWNFSCRSLLEDESGKTSAAITSLMRRCSEGNDLLIPMGYAGAFHPLLLTEELKDEIEWAKENPWGTGFKQVFNADPAIWMPMMMDLYRRSSTFFYRDNPKWWIEAPPFKKIEYPLGSEITLHEGRQASSFPLLHFPGPVFKEIRRMYQLVNKKLHTSLAVIIDCSPMRPEIVIQSLEALKRGLKKNMGLRFNPIAKLSNSHSGPKKGVGDPLRGLVAAGMDPASRMNRIEAYSLRVSPQNPGRNRKVLSTLSVLENPTLHRSSHSFAGEFPPERLLIANMPGNTVMREGPFSAHFSEGRLRDFSSNNTHLLAGRPASSYILGDNRYDFSKTSSFAFEGDNVRGMRELLLFDHPIAEEPGTLIIDYYTIEDFPYITVSVYAQYPCLSSAQSVKGYALLEVPIFNFRDNSSIFVQSEYPDKSSYERPVPAREEMYLFPGSTFRFSNEETGATLLLAFPKEKQHITEALPVRVSKQGKVFTFSINPWGSYTPLPLEHIRGGKEHFSFFLAAGLTPPSPPEESKQVQKELHPIWSMPGH